MRRGDRAMLLITAALLAAGVVLAAERFFFAPAESGLTAVVTQDGRVLRRIRLSGAKNEEFTLTYKGGWNRIRVSDGEIEVSDADCRDRDCVKRGPLRRAGDSAVCLPHRLEIRLSGEPEVDGATY